MPVSLPEPELQGWLRLTLEPELTPTQAHMLLSRFGLPSHLFTASVSELSQCVPTTLAARLKAAPEADIQAIIDATLAWLKEPNHHVLTLSDALYPRRLFDLADAPLVLYVNGRPELLSSPSVAVVGARSATMAGTDNATAFSSYLSQHGWCIVSGLADGIDAAAHKGALLSGSNAGSTIAVMATGIDLVYPARNRSLAHEIAAYGALVTEFPLGMRALPYHFPKRNRLVAALAHGVLVVEAALKSGSLITARQANEMGREVFAIPGSIHSPLSRGCHALIRQGAKLVESGQDILEELGQGKLGLPRQAGPRNKVSSSAASNPVLVAMGFDPIDLDTLGALTGLGPGELASQLLELELQGLVAREEGGRFQQRAPGA
jgi:DNA processing protein